MQEISDISRLILFLLIYSIRISKHENNKISVETGLRNQNSESQLYFATGLEN